MTTTHTHTGEKGDDLCRMEMAATLADNSADISAWLDASSCFQGSTCREVQLRKTNGHNTEPQCADGAKREVLPQPHMQLVTRERTVLTARHVGVKGGGGTSHHAPPLRLTEQKGKVKAYETNIHGHIQSAIVKYELHHNIKKDTQSQTPTVFRSWTSATVAFHKQRAADESLKQTR